LPLLKSRQQRDAPSRQRPFWVTTTTQPRFATSFPKTT